MNSLLTKWKKDETEFIVGINYNSKRGTQTYIPKPIIEFLEEPTTLKFSLKNNKVIITSGD